MLSIGNLKARDSLLKWQSDFFDIFSFKKIIKNDLIKRSICYRNPYNPKSIDLIMTIGLEVFKILAQSQKNYACVNKIYDIFIAENVAIPSSR